jgi:isocitrate lyase
MEGYKEMVGKSQTLLDGKANWNAIEAESIARMRTQNRFLTGIDVARYCSNIMRQDLAEYEKDPSKYTQSLGCWHGFVAQQVMISVKKHFGTTKRKYLYLSGWMVAAMRSKFGPLPDQSMHEKTAVPSLIEEIYTFLKQADARDLTHLFRELDAAKSENDQAKIDAILAKIDGYESHVVPMICDIDAGYGNEEATYLLAKKMIEAGACCIQLENQVSDAKQCGHQDGKVTVPHEDFLSKINAVRYAFLELGVPNGVIVARTDSLGASLTQKIPVTKEAGDLASKYNSFLELTPVESMDKILDGTTLLKMNGKLCMPTRLANGLYRFKPNTGFDRAVLDCITSLKNGADLLWIETPDPHVGKMAKLVNSVRKEVPNAKLVYNNSPSFNWTLKMRQQVYDEWVQEGKKNVTAYDRKLLMAEDYDGMDLAVEADRRIHAFQKEAAAKAGVFHHLITLPTYHTAALSSDMLAKKYFSDMGMLAYVQGVQRTEIRTEVACVKHQDMAGTYIGDDHKEYFSGDAALKASGKNNTMNQFENVSARTTA